MATKLLTPKAPAQECAGSLRGYQVNAAACLKEKLPLDCAASIPPPPAATSYGSCRRNIFLDMGANWCNTLQLFKDVPEAKTHAHADRPWHVFAVEAAPLISPYVEQCVERLAAGEPLPTPPVPPAGSSMQLLNYASDLGCTGEKVGKGRRERMNCIGAKLQKPLAKLAKTANPSLTSNAALLRARLDGARTRGGCEAVPPRSKKSGGGLFLRSWPALAASTAAYRADGWVTKDGGSYSLLPAAAGASEGNLRRPSCRC